MPRRSRELRPEQQICQWILAQTRKVVGCEALDLRFALVRRDRPADRAPSWELRGVSGWSAWPAACREAFATAVRDAQAKFDILYGPGDGPSLSRPRTEEPD